MSGDFSRFTELMLYKELTYFNLMEASSPLVKNLIWYHNGLTLTSEAIWKKCNVRHQINKKIINGYPHIHEFNEGGV